MQLTSTATLTITVTDGDDLGPQFRHLACQKAFGGKCFTPTYNADVESVLEVSSFILKIITIVVVQYLCFSLITNPLSMPHTNLPYARLN